MVAYGRPASEALATAIGRAKAGVALAPVTVIVPSNFAGLAARRLLGSAVVGSGGVANVGFLTPFRLAELLASDRLLDRRPLTNPVVGAAVRLALADSPGPFARVRDHVATEVALAALYAELSNVGPQALEQLAASNIRAARTAVEFHGAIATRLEPFHDEADVASAAATRDDLAQMLTPFGHIIWFLPEPTTAPMTRFVAAILTAAPSSVIIGVTGELGADQPVFETCRRAGVAMPAEPTAALAPVADNIISVTDADEEVRAVLRSVIELAEAGVPLERIAIFHPAPIPYVGILEQQLAAAGIPANGPSRRRLNDSVAGRTLLDALQLPAQRWRRDRVMALVSGAPVRYDGHSARPAAWEMISREAGIVQHEGDWTHKLKARRTTVEARLAELEPDDRRIPSLTRAIDDIGALDGFVADLVSAVKAVGDASGWIEKSTGAMALLTQLLGAGHIHSNWPEVEQAAFERVVDALSRLATLDELEPNPSADVFVRALTAELDVSQGRNGRFGEGVQYGPLAAAIGQDLDAVFVLGCREGLSPAARRDDAMLPDSARALTGGELELRAERLHSQHRQFLTALAAAPAGRRTLTFARGDLRGGRRSLPSRWLLDTASALQGSTVHSTDFDELSTEVVSKVPSHATGVVTAAVHASLADRDLAAVSRHVRLGGDALAHPVTGSVRRGLLAQRARRSVQFTEWDGNLAGHAIPAGDDRPWSPTRLQGWASCGYQYFLGYVLGLNERDEPERVLDLAPIDRGSGVHLVLERFMVEAIAAGVPDPHQPWTAQQRQQLRAIAEEVFDEYEQRGRTGRAVHWQLTLQDLFETLDAFLHHDNDHRLVTLSRPSHVELAFGFGDTAPVTVGLPGGRTLSFRGMIDRVDRSDDGHVLVSDYKTGKGKQYHGLDEGDPVRAGTLLQLGVYAEAAAQHFGAEHIDTHYWMVDPAGGFLRHGYRWTPQHRERLIEVVSTIVEGIDDGVFPMVPGEWDGFRNTHGNCTYCAFDQVCSRDRGEQAAAKVDAPQLKVRTRLVVEPQ